MGPSDDICWLTLSEIARRLQSREISPVDVTRAILDRIGAVDSRLHAFITVDEEGALAAARAAESALLRGDTRGPLHGVPLSLKDQFATRGLLTTCASLVYENWVPDFDSAMMTRIRESGAVLLGKCNMYELATGWGTVGHFSLAVNPRSSAHTPGGSSSGSAVAVAAGLGYASIATDGGGSIRVPSNYCGIVGLKPTYGRVSSFGVIPVATTVEHSGVIARTAEDAAIVLGVIAGYDPRDPVSADVKIDDYRGGLTGDAAGLRVGVPWDYIEGQVSEENLEAFREALEALADAGASIVRIAGLVTEDVALSWTRIVYAELAAFHRVRYLSTRDKFGSELQSRIDAGLATKAIDYIDAFGARARLRQRFLEVLRDVDLIVTPTAPDAAPLLDDLTARAAALPVVGQLARYTRPYNLTGLPAITVPNGASEGGLPFGFQLAGRPFEERAVLRAAHAYQTRTHWHQARPMQRI